MSRCATYTNASFSTENEIEGNGPRGSSGGMPKAGIPVSMKSLAFSNAATITWAIALLYGGLMHPALY